MVGKAIRVSMMTEAPTTPVMAAKRTPMTATEIAVPPGMARNSRCKVSSRSLANCERSNITPMKISSGTAMS